MQNPDKMRHYRLSYLGFMRILICSLLLTAAMGQPSAVPDLTGVWQREFVLQPLVSGELVIDAREKPVTAAIGGYRAHVTQDGDRFSFSLPGHIGEFRGRLTAAREISGDWIQPGLAFPYNQRYATPVSLSLLQPNVWRGEATPLEPRASIYLVIQRDAQGKLVACFRNPEANIFGRNRYDVNLTGDTIALTSPHHQLTGRYDQNTETITLPLLNGYPPVSLTRPPSDADLLRFRPRPQAPQAYSYRPPSRLATVGRLAHSLKSAWMNTESTNLFMPFFLPIPPTTTSTSKDCLSRVTANWFSRTIFTASTASVPTTCARRARRLPRCLLALPPITGCSVPIRGSCRSFRATSHSAIRTGARTA